MTIQKADLLQKRQRLYARIAKFNQMAQLFMSKLDIDVTFYQDNPAFCPEKKGESLNDEEREGGHSGKVRQMRMLKKVDTKMTQMRAFLKISCFGCHPMLGPPA
jgi:hypothetical protein